MLGAAILVAAAAVQQQAVAAGPLRGGAGAGAGANGCSLKYLTGTWIEGYHDKKSYTAEAYISPQEPSRLRLKCQHPKALSGMGGRGAWHKKPSPASTHCGWRQANCTIAAAKDGQALVCSFELNGGKIISEKASIEEECSRLVAWTGTASNFSDTWYHEYKQPSCQAFVDNDVCKAKPSANYTGCQGPGGCGNPASCVDCTLQYTGGHGSGHYEGLYVCSGGLEDVRAACNATKGRLPSKVITLDSGKIQGFKDLDYKHTVFRGIPYAAPPVGDLRWRPPQPPTAWQGVRNTTTFGNTCKQVGPAWTTMGGVRTSSEDCLYLNVYAPARHIPAAGGTLQGEAPAPAKLPVLMYFPAGQFMWGSGNDAENFIAPQTAAGAEMIVVTSNYRLGAAGYLALDELRSRDPTNSTGNYGSQDQRAALVWIKRNIAAFGGDPNNVVLWGESAGSAAVTAHLVMKKSWPYFSKAIMESSTFNGWSYKTMGDATANAHALAKHLNCTNKGSGAISVPCLLNVSIDTMVMLDDDAAGIADNSLGMPFGDRVDKSLWSPAIDNVELFGSPADLLADGKVAKVPMLFGTNRDEGSTFTYNQSGTGDSNGHAGADVTSMYDGFLFNLGQLWSNSWRGPPNISAQSFSTGLFVNESEFTTWATKAFNSSVAKTLAAMYHPVQAGHNPNATGTAAPPAPAPTPAPVYNPEGITDWWWSMSRVIGDWVLSCPARRAARHLEKLHLGAYVYHFNHTPAMSINQRDTPLYGAFHGSEVPFVFYSTFELAEASERKLSEAMVQYWAGFAWNGDPNVPPPTMAGGLNGLPYFPRYAAADDEYIILGDTTEASYPNVTTIKGLKRHECDFWDSLHLGLV